MTEYFLHIGLHKTGTKFFQYKVFPNISKEKFNYNPPKLTQLVCDLMKAEEEDLDHVLNEIKKEKKIIHSQGERSVVISREIMSGDLFSFYKDFDRSSSRLKSAFSEANIICFLRYQPDWIVSCYRESIHEHHYQDIEEFLGIKDQMVEFIRCSYKDLDLNRIVRLLNDKFGEEKIHVFFYEDFKSDKSGVVEKIAKLIGSSKILITLDNNQVPNRGYSALGVKLSIIRYRFLKYFGLAGLLAHRPIYFMGPNGIPAGFEHLSVLPREKYWHDGFLRDNEEVRSKNYPKLSIVEKIKFEFSWRNLVKNRIDRLFYLDWDLLGKYRDELDTYYKEQNKKLGLKRVPSNYY